MHGSPLLWTDESRICDVEILGWRCRWLLENNLHWAWSTWDHMDVYSLVSDLLDAIVVWVILWPIVSLVIHSEATEFDFIFSWSLAIQVLAVYVGFSRFRFTIRSRMHLESIDLDRKGEVLCDLWDWVQKIFGQSICEYWKKISWDSQVNSSRANLAYDWWWDLMSSS